MLNEQIVMADGNAKTKLDIAINRLKSFEPKDGYFVAFSGGKDSQCIYHLCEMAGVKFDAHYSVTGVDPPEVIYFIRENYPDVSFDYSRYADGTRITMWNLIVKKRMPPTQLARYCCEKLKESSGIGRVTVTGVRWAESVRRRQNTNLVNIIGKPKGTQKIAETLRVDYGVSKKGSIVLNDDNDTSRRMVEQCYRTRKTMVNPIVDWTDAEVWEFLDEIVKVPHCCLYDEGFSRIGCIGCPMGGGKKGMTRDFEHYPKYKTLYLKAFDKMLKKNREDGLQERYKDAEALMNWWMCNEDSQPNTALQTLDGE